MQILNLVKLTEHSWEKKKSKCIRASDGFIVFGIRMVND